MPAKRMPYKSTTVRVEVTQHRDITGLFAKYDIDAWQFSTRKKARRAQVRFELPSGRWVRVTIKAPINEDMTDKQIEGAEKATWRALYFWLKTQFEATFDYNLFREDEAFLPWLEIDGAESPTVADQLLPMLGDMPKLLGPGL